MTNPRRYLLRMVVFVIAVVAIVLVLIGPLAQAFAANPPLNGLIVGVLLLGIVHNFRQIAGLYPEIEWIESFRRQRAGVSQTHPPRLLAPMATMLSERRELLRLSTHSMRSLLDGISSRLDEARDLSRYTIGLLIFLGLLGTFWGLLETAGSIRQVIGGLSVGGDDLGRVFADLQAGLQAPLAGMGTAFSSSLFGLAGSLVLGFLDLQTGQAQNRFYTDVEDWLSSLTRLSSGALAADGEQSVPAYMQALLEQSAESIENLQRTLTRGEESRIAANSSLVGLTEKLGTLADLVRTQQSLMLRIAENQTDIQPLLAKLVEARVQSGGGLDEASKAHLRNLDVYMTRLLDDLGKGREEIVRELRSEIKLLARTIAALAEETDR